MGPILCGVLECSRTFYALLENYRRVRSGSDRERVNGCVVLVQHYTNDGVWHIGIGVSETSQSGLGEVSKSMPCSLSGGAGIAMHGWLMMWLLRMHAVHGRVLPGWLNGHVPASECEFALRIADGGCEGGLRKPHYWGITCVAG